MSSPGLALSQRRIGLRGSSPLRRAIPLLAAVATANVGLAYAAFDRGETKYVLVGILWIEVFAFCVLRPRAALLWFVGLWGAFHVLLSNGGAEGGGGSGASASQLIGITVVLGFGVALLRLHSHRDRPLPFPLRALAVFAVLYLAAEAISPSQSSGLSDLVKLAGGLILALVGYYTINDERHLLTLTRVVSLAGLLVGALALAQYALGYDFGIGTSGNSTGVYRATSALGSASATADFLLVCAGFALLHYTMRRGQQRVTSDLTILAVISAGMVVTFTRADIIALVVMLVIWAFLWQVPSVNAVGMRARLVLLLVVAGIATIQVVGANSLVSRFEGRSSSQGAGFLNGRGAIWSNELQKLQSAEPGTLLLGKGAHTSYTSVYIPQSYAYRQFPAHDLFLWLLIETGVLGLVTYSAAFLSVGRNYLKTAGRYRFTSRGRVAAVAFAATVAYVLDSMFHNTQLSTGSNWYFMLFIGTTLRMIQPQNYDQRTG